MSDVIKKDNKFVANKETVDITGAYEDIKVRIDNARAKIYKHIDNSAVEVYWYVGKIVSELLGLNSRAEYGKSVINLLAEKLTKDYGEGFESSNIRRMRRFYEYFPNWDAVRPELSWSHYRELIKIERDAERNFYMQESIKSN